MLELATDLPITSLSARVEPAASRTAAPARGRRRRTPPLPARGRGTAPHTPGIDGPDVRVPAPCDLDGHRGGSRREEVGRAADAPAVRTEVRRWEPYDPRHAAEEGPQLSRREGSARRWVQEEGRARIETPVRCSCPSLVEHRGAGGEEVCDTVASRVEDRLVLRLPWGLLRREDGEHAVASVRGLELHVADGRVPSRVVVAARHRHLAWPEQTLTRGGEDGVLG